MGTNEEGEMWGRWGRKKPQRGGTKLAQGVALRFGRKREEKSPKGAALS
jgi:hypothetical protein